MSGYDRVADLRDPAWLKRYYATRAGFSLAWVASAFAAGGERSAVTGALLVAYPAWDAAANLYDARRSGGLKSNPTQLFNAGVSAIVAIVVAVSLCTDARPVLYAFGAWALLAGFLQLATGARRWKGVAAQWPMILSGAQSGLAGVHFVQRGLAGAVPVAKLVAPYAAFGALYFTLSAGLLAASALRRRPAPIR